MDQNRSLLNALRLERIVSLLTVSLIELVAALNILVVLVMLVLEKGRDVAILMSMGARRAQVQRIFMLQGLIIGGVGCALGLVLGYTTTALFNHYRWLRLDEQGLVRNLKLRDVAQRLVEARSTGAAEH